MQESQFNRMEAEAETIAKTERRRELRDANILAWKQGKPGIYEHYLSLDNSNLL